MNKTCLYCQEPFETKTRYTLERQEEQKFCKPECANKFKTQFKICKWCGEEFTGRNKKYFCSQKCSSASRIVYKICLHCGNEYHSHAKKYCKPECYREATKGEKRNPYVKEEKLSLCENCNKPFQKRNKKSRFHSRECLYEWLKGKNSPNWKGGRTIQGGYVKILKPEHHEADPRGYIFEHRYVMEQKLGRLLTRIETVHHINLKRDDNRPENLQIRRGKHGSGACYCCADCGSANIVEKSL